MLRITENNEDNRITSLRLDGTITEESYVDLENALSKHPASDRRPIVLDMSGVVFMQDSVARKLGRLRGESLQIINGSPFIAALLDMAAATGGKP